MPLIGRAEVPNLFRSRSFSAADLAETVNHFVDLGEDEAKKSILSIASLDDIAGTKADGARVMLPRVGSLFERDRRERLCWMCRILYEPDDDNKPLRSPSLGALFQLPSLTMTDESFPLYPLVRVRQTYFVLSEGYGVAGHPESVAHYLEYCQSHSQFRRTRLEIPSRESAIADAETLRQSAEWKNIEWRNDDPTESYDLDENRVWQFIKGQALKIPE